MHDHLSKPRRTLWHSAKVLTLLPSLLLAAASPTQSASAGQADATYRQDRAACLDGRSTTDRAACLKEAGAARAETRRQTLDNGESAMQLRANALQRCGRVPMADRTDCERMALGEGKRSGSVAEGAVIKEITTTIPALPAEPAASR